MRQIGTIHGESAARHLADHLLSLGVTTRLREDPDGWGVWVLDENRLPLARQEFDVFRDNPGDARFQAAPQTAEQIRREAELADKKFRKNFRFASDIWDRPSFRRRPLTLALIVACTVVFLLLNVPRTRRPVEDAMAFSAAHIEQVDGQFHLRRGGFEDILHGEIWRLISPIFMHFGIVHLLFDLWALALFGSLIEYRRGTRTLALLVLLTAIASNVGEALLEISNHGHTMTFGGMSGVVYALFGYVWMKGRNEPEQGMILHPSNVQTMLIWLFLCMTGFLGNIANGAHVVGLVAGILCGLARL